MPLPKAFGTNPTHHSLASRGIKDSANMSFDINDVKVT